MYVLWYITGGLPVRIGLNLVPCQDLPNSTSPQFLKLSFPHALSPLLAHDLLQDLFVNLRSGFRDASLVDQVSTFELRLAFSQLLDGLIGHGLDPSNLLAIRLTSWGEGDQST
jgi:hypothetical protein